MIIIIAVSLILGLIYWLFMSPYSQVFGKFPYKTDTKDKVIALTFDDGPNEPFTSDLLNFLKSKGVRATFFQVGKCIERYPEVTKRLDHDGHIVGNHSYNHAFHKYFTEPTFAMEIRRTQEVISKTIGKTPALFRPPWLWRQPMLLKTAKSNGLTTISGEFGHVLEVFQPSAKKMANKVVKKARPGSIIIFHDGFDSKGGNRAQTIEAIKIIVVALQEKGFEFVTIDKLLGVPAYQ